MYQKFSQRVDGVVKRARSLARDADQEYLGTEHLLIAIIQEGTGIGAKLLEALNVDEYRLKAEIERLVKTSLEQTWVFGSLPGSPYLKNAVAGAVSIAEELQAKDVCTEHLVLAMLKEEGSVAESALRKLGVTYDQARRKISEITLEA